MEDNMYPSNGEYFLPTEPKEQTKERSKERANTLAAKPVLQKILKRYEKRIAKTDSIKQAMLVSETYNTSRETALVGLDIARNEFESEKEWIEGLLGEYSE